MSDIRFNGWLHRSGTGGVYQDSSGRVGVGTSTPNMSLHVLSSSDDVARLQSTSASNGPALTLDHIGASPADGDIIGKVVFNGEDDGANSTTYADIRAISTDVSNGSEDGDITFGTRAAGTYAERLRINSTGQLIIGGDVTPYATRSATFQPPASQTNSYISIIAGNTSSVSALTFGDAAGQAAGNYAGMFEYYHSDDSLRYAQNASEKLRIDSSGRLLIGTTTEGHVSADNLTIYGSGDCGITIRSGATSEGSIMFSDGTSGADEYRGWINYNQNSNYLRFFTDTAERLRIDASGRMGLGTNNPSSWDSSADDFVIYTSGNTGITINSGSAGSTSEGNICFAEGTAGSADKFRGAVQYKHGDDLLKFYTNNTNRLEVGEHTTIKDGNLVIATAGHGIDFSATSDGASSASYHEVLDDYEEGVWTMTCDYSVTLSQNQLRYTKIGNLVNISGAIIVNSDNGGSTFQPNNLPFANVGSGFKDLATFSAHTENWDLNVNHRGFGGYAENSKLYMRQHVDNGAVTVLPADASAVLFLNITYHTT